MLMILFSLNLLMSMIFISLIHPLSMGMILLLQTLLISLITGNFSFNFWFSYILFLILVGGMLILFMYMTSIASNEKFSFNMKSIIMSIAFPITMMIPSIYFYINSINNEMINQEFNMMINYSLNKYINYPSNLILIFMMMYLLLTMIASVKITNFKHGPIRHMN
uniref:NADH-ubiquinone oxidoreductase chain 6 n=1 Tax=Pelecyphorus foveolatus TaxID=2841848 RepID=A0A8F3JBI2_9CUCU|nr:NADH dehydrogenase subunit 6 [Pelecyphorus foveolatus]